ncbi:barstar family protein [Brevundimonas sp.]|uniref:barstar family protein n=1 Tax=Brevundimonas sp. TaxID=1871086 RepID=UPI0026062940|nr:barstar family protein [Brevundimonas sp.]
MPLRLEIESGKIDGLEDVHDLVAELPGLPIWFGRNLDALSELAYFVKEPLDIVLINSSALERRLGRRDYKALMSTLEDIRDSPNDDPNWQPVTLTLTPLRR